MTGSYPTDSFIIIISSFCLLVDVPSWEFIQRHMLPVSVFLSYWTVIELFHPFDKFTPEEVRERENLLNSFSVTSESGEMRNGGLRIFQLLLLLCVDGER